MDENIKNKIEHFYNWYNQQRQNAMDLNYNFGRIILLATVDTLSKYAFPNMKNNFGKRFIKLIDEYSDWQDKDRISLPQLLILLKNKNHNKYKKEITLIENKLMKFQNDAIPLSYEIDPLISDLIKEIGEVDSFVHKARYASLLWKMRNFAVHECRHPGNGFAVAGDQPYPYYVSFIKFTNDNYNDYIETLEFVIPNEVISNIIINCINNLKVKFTNEGVNPFYAIKDSSSWFDI